MKYSFKPHSYLDGQSGTKKLAPLLFIEDQEKYGDFLLDEISNLSLEYLTEIVTSLEKVLKGILGQYKFGYEIYSIECNPNIAKVIDVYEDWKTVSEIPTQEIYELLRDWNEYLKEFEIGK